MGKVHGKHAELTLNGVTITTYCNSFDFQRVVDLLDTHTFGDSAKEVIPGLTDATISVSGLYDDVATEIDAHLNSMFGQASGGLCSIWPAGDSFTTYARYGGTAFMRNYSIGMNVSEVTTHSFDLQFSGGVTRAIS